MFWISGFSCFDFLDFWSFAGRAHYEKLSHGKPLRNTTENNLNPAGKQADYEIPLVASP